MGTCVVLQYSNRSPSSRFVLIYTLSHRQTSWYCSSMAHCWHWILCDVAGLFPSRLRARQRRASNSWLADWSRWLMVPFPLPCGPSRHFDHYDFASLFVYCPFHSALAYMAYCRSAKFYRSSFRGVHRWFLYGFADVRVHQLIGAVFPFRKRNASDTLGADRLYATWANALMISFADRYSLAAALEYRRPLSQNNPYISDPQLVSPSVTDAYKIDLDAKGEWDFSDIQPSGKIDVHSSLRLYFTVILNKSVA